MRFHEFARRTSSGKLPGGTRIKSTTVRSKYRSGARRIACAAVAALTMGLLTTPAGATTQKTAEKYYSDIATIFEDTNTIRKSVGKKALKYDARITVVAYDWSVALDKANALSHNPKYSQQIPSGWTRAGENVAFACGYGSKSASVIVQNWRKSPKHYTNLVGDFTSVGIGVYWDGRCMWATQNFGKYANVVSYSVPTSKGSSLISGKTGNTSSVAKGYVASSKTYYTQAESVRVKSAKVVSTAKSQSAAAQTLAKKKGAKATTKTHAAKAAKQYALAKADYGTTKRAAAKAKAAYVEAKELMKTSGTTNKVKAQRDRAKNFHAVAKKYYGYTKAHQAKVSHYRNLAVKAAQ